MSMRLAFAGVSAGVLLMLSASSANAVDSFSDYSTVSAVESAPYTSDDCGGADNCRPVVEPVTFASLNESNRGVVDVHDGPGYIANTEVVVDVPVAFEQFMVQATLFGQDYHESLGTFDVADDATITLTIPASAIQGDYRLAVVDVNDVLLGWNELRVAEGISASDDDVPGASDANAADEDDVTLLPLPVSEAPTTSPFTSSAPPAANVGSDAVSSVSTPSTSALGVVSAAGSARASETVTALPAVTSASTDSTVLAMDALAQPVTTDVESSAVKSEDGNIVLPVAAVAPVAAIPTENTVSSGEVISLIALSLVLIACAFYLIKTTQWAGIALIARNRFLNFVTRR